MPIYEYSCESCGKEFEELVFGDTPPTCPGCGATECQKLMSAHAVGKGGAPAPTGGPCGNCPSRAGGGCGLD